MKFIVSVLAITALALSMSGGAQPEFRDYPADTTLSTRSTRLRYTDTDLQRFRTRLAQALHDGPNFAGRFSITIWGCGTGCQTGAIVNVETGEAYPLPSTMVRGVDYRLSSRLLAIDPVWDDTLNGLDSLIAPYTLYYEWRDTTFVLIDSIAIVK